jgi:hypothetical protein
VTVTGLPFNGSAVYVRLWDRIGSVWTYQDYGYTAWAMPVQQITPAPPYTFTGTSQAFSWLATGGDEYALWVGTSPGGSQIADKRPGTGTAVTVTGLPFNGGSIYVRLWTRLGTLWISEDHVYAAWTMPAPQITPAAPYTFTGTSQAFSWVATGGDEYALWVGTSPGGREIADRRPGTGTSVTVTGLPFNGSAVYVRLWDRIGSVWTYQDYVYTAWAMPVQQITPAPPYTFTGTSQVFSWVSTGADEYALFVGSSPGASDIADMRPGIGTSVTVTGLPFTGGNVYVRLWNRLGTLWTYRDYVYIAWNADQRIVSPTPSGPLAGTSATFTWNGGADEYALWVGLGPGARDIVDRRPGTSTTTLVTGLPANRATVHVRLWYRFGGSWFYTDYRYNALDLNFATIDTLTAPSFRGASAPSATVLAHIVVNPDGTLTDLTGNTSWTAVGGAIPHGNTGLWSRGRNVYSGPFDVSHYWVGDAATKTWLDTQTAGNFVICARIKPGEHPGTGGNNKIVFSNGKPEMGGHDGWALMQMHSSFCFHYHANTDTGEAMRPIAWPSPNDVTGVLPTFDYSWICGGRNADVLGVFADGQGPNGVYQMEGDPGTTLATPSFRVSAALPSIGAYADGSGMHDGGVYEVIITNDAATGAAMTRIVSTAASGILVANPLATYLTGADALLHRIDPSNVIGTITNGTVTPQAYSHPSDALYLHWGVPLASDTQQTGACIGFDATVDGSWAAADTANWIPLLERADDDSWRVQIQNAGNCVNVNGANGFQAACGTRSPAPADGSRHTTLACFSAVDSGMRLYADGSTTPYAERVPLTGGTAAFPRLNDGELLTPFNAPAGIHIHRIWACSGSDPARCP